MLKHISIFSGLSDEELGVIAERSVTRTYPKNTILINEGDIGNALFVVLSGKVKVFVSDSSGKEFVLNVLGENEYFGEMALLDDETRTASVMTVEKSSFCILNKEDFLPLVLSHPNLMSILLKNLVCRIRQLTDNIKALALKDVYGRVKRLLEDLATTQAGQAVVQDKLTQQDIADRVGSSREMVARILKDLTIGGYISIEKKQIVLLNKLPESY